MAKFCDEMLFGLAFGIGFTVASAVIKLVVSLLGQSNRIEK